MITAPEIFSAVGPVSAACSACWPSSPSAMKIAEKLRDEGQARPDHPPGPDLPGRDAGDRGDVARHERQHARGEERDQPGAERDREADARGDVHRTLADRRSITLAGAADAWLCSAASVMVAFTVADVVRQGPVRWSADDGKRKLTVCERSSEELSTEPTVTVVKVERGSLRTPQDP